MRFWAASSGLGAMCCAPPFQNPFELSCNFLACGCAVDAARKRFIVSGVPMPAGRDDSRSQSFFLELAASRPSNPRSRFK